MNLVDKNFFDAMSDPIPRYAYDVVFTNGGPNSQPTISYENVSVVVKGRTIEFTMVVTDKWSPDIHHHALIRMYQDLDKQATTKPFIAVGYHLKKLKTVRIKNLDGGEPFSTGPGSLVYAVYVYEYEFDSIQHRTMTISK
jgi:hypothetical protein